MTKKSLFFIIVLSMLAACSPSPEALATQTAGAWTPMPQATATTKSTPIVYSDKDNDGLSDQKELKIGSDIENADSDGDGLTDYDEVTKYFLDPLNSDSDNDGIFDFDMDERREYTYTIYAKMKIIPPYDIDSMTDHFQEINVLEEKSDSLLFEIYFYPNSYHIIEELPFDPDSYLSNELKGFLEPDSLMNFDDEMKNLVETEILRSNKDISDLEIVKEMYQWEKSSINWMPGTSDSSKPYPEPFLDLYINENNEIIFPSTPIMFSEPISEFSDIYSEELFDRDWQLKSIILGKEMYLNKSHGSCGSIANFHSTILRSIGIPTRIIQTIPMGYLFEKSQKKILENLSESTKNQIISRMGYNHFLVEAFIGNRWVRINNSDIEDHLKVGDFIKIIAFASWKDANFADTWGYKKPYELIAIDEIEPIYQPIIQDFD